VNAARICELAEFALRKAVIAVFDVLTRHIPRGQVEKMRNALPDELKVLWNFERAAETSIKEQASIGRETQNARTRETINRTPRARRGRA